MSKKAKVIPVSFRKKASYNALEEKDQNIIGQRIQELRRQYGITLSNLSGILADYGIEISSGALNKWEVGSTIPNSYQLVAISKVFGIESPDFFTSQGEESELNEEGKKKLADYKSDLIATGRYIPEKRRFEGSIVYVDMPVSYLAASAGTGAFLDEGNFEMVSVPKNTIPAGAEFGIRVSGDSMMPTYCDGQIVWIQQCQTLNPGEVGIFIYDGEGYIKSYEEQEPEDREAFTDSYGICHMQPVMVSYNPKYPPRVVLPDVRFEIVGRVLN